MSADRSANHPAERYAAQVRALADAIAEERRARAATTEAHNAYRAAIKAEDAARYAVTLASAALAGDITRDQILDEDKARRDALHETGKEPAK